MGKKNLLAPRELTLRSDESLAFQTKILDKGPESSEQLFLFTWLKAIRNSPPVYPKKIWSRLKVWRKM